MMSPRGRAALFAAALLVSALGLAACGAPAPAPTDVTSDVDRERAAYLSADPLMRTAITPPDVSPGVVHSEKLGWDRTEVSARLYQSAGGSGPTPETVEQVMTTAATTLRDGGWVVHWQMCLPPPQLDFSGMVNEEPIPMPVVRAPGYEWLISAHKINNGVSYWALVFGMLGDGQAIVEAVFRAPNARDTANLMSPEPAALGAGLGCAEDGRVSEEIEKAGTPTMIRDWWPFPAETHSRNPNQV